MNKDNKSAEINDTDKKLYISDDISQREQLINFTVWLMNQGYITTDTLSANNIVNRYNEID